MNINDYKKAISGIEPQEYCKENILNAAKNEMKIYKKNISKKYIFIPVLAAVLVCGGIAAGATILSGFRRTQNVWEQEREQINANNETVVYSYEKFDHNNYNMLESAAETPNSAAASDNVDLVIESAYFDGLNLVCSIKAVTDIMPEAMVINTTVNITAGGITYHDTIFDDGYTAIDLMLLRDNTDLNSYYGTLDFRLAEPIKETSDITIIFMGFTGYRSGVYTENNFVNRIDERIEADISVTPQPELLKTIDVNYESNTMYVKSVEYSPYGIGVTYQTSGEVLVLYDSDGNKIPSQERYLQDNEWTTEFFEAADTSFVTVKLIDKNSENIDLLNEITVRLNQ